MKYNNHPTMSSIGTCGLGAGAYCRCNSRKRTACTAYTHSCVSSQTVFLSGSGVSVGVERGSPLVPDHHPCRPYPPAGQAPSPLCVSSPPDFQEPHTLKTILANRTHQLYNAHMSIHNDCRSPPPPPTLQPTLQRTRVAQNNCMSLPHPPPVFVSGAVPRLRNKCS